MSLKLGVFDFFSYTIPGAIYLACLLSVLNQSGLLILDIDWLDLSFTNLIITGTLSFLLGMLFYPLARNLWYMPIYKRYPHEQAYQLVKANHPELEFRFRSEQWGSLRGSIKMLNTEVGTEIDKLMALSTMLRNASFALLLSAISILGFAIKNPNWLLHLVLGTILIVLSISSLTQSHKYAQWTYGWVYDIYVGLRINPKMLIKKRKK